MTHDATDPRQELRATLQQQLDEVRARRVAREADPVHRAALRARDDEYVARAAQRRQDVQRLRLHDGLPSDLGGRRAASPDALRASLRATRDGLTDAGLFGELSSGVLDDLWRSA